VIKIARRPAHLSQSFSFPPICPRITHRALSLAKKTGPDAKVNDSEWGLDVAERGIPYSQRLCALLYSFKLGSLLCWRVA